MQRFIVIALLVILLVSAVAIVIVSWPHWRFGRLLQDNPTQVTDYSDRVSDLEKLISALIGLSAIYTIALGLSSWASVQMNLQQAKESVESAQRSLENLNALVDLYKHKVNELDAYRKGVDADMKVRADYARVIPNVMAILALALQREDYIPVADSVIQDLRNLRDENPTDAKVSFFLGRAYKIRKHFRMAVDAMTFFIDAKHAAKESHHSSLADAYYNRACYQSLLWSPTLAADAKLALQSAIIADVPECCRRDPQLLGEIEKSPDGDPDLDPVRGESWFQDTLTKLHQAGY